MANREREIRRDREIEQRRGRGAAPATSDVRALRDNADRVVEAGGAAIRAALMEDARTFLAAVPQETGQ